MTDKWNSKEKWLAEIAPKKSGNFIASDATAGNYTNTRDPWAAMQFETQKACETWCEANSGLKCYPVLHGFAEKG